MQYKDYYVKITPGQNLIREGRVVQSFRMRRRMNMLIP